MVNRSKINSEWQWAKWRASGAVATMEDALNGYAKKDSQDYNSPYNAGQALNNAKSSKVSKLVRAMCDASSLKPENQDPHKWQNLGFYANQALQHPKVSSEHQGMIVEAIVKSQTAFYAVQALANPKLSKEFHSTLVEVIENYVNSPQNYGEDKKGAVAHYAVEALKTGVLEDSLKIRLISVLNSAGNAFYLEQAKQVL